MSARGCWNCGASSHHRRDCEVKRDTDSAVQIKKEAARDHRGGKKTEAEREKASRRLEMKNEPTASVGLLKKHLGISLQQIFDVELLLDEVGPPSSSKTSSQLIQLVLCENNLRKQYAVMREIVGSAKVYLHSVRVWNNEEQIMKIDVDYLDDVRPKLLARLCTAIADLKEIERLMKMFLQESQKLVECLDRSEILLGERSPSIENAEKSIEILMHGQQSLVKTKELATEIKTLAPDFEMQLVDDGENRILDLQIRRRKVLEDKVAEFEDSVTCSICCTEPKDVALKCGHRLCAGCVQKIRQHDDLCPICKRRLRVAVQHLY